MSNKIQILDFLKYAENNRQSLIANAREKGKYIENTASLSHAVAVNNSIEPAGEPEQIGKSEVRFFDVDGSQIGDSQWVEYGGSCVSPANPTYDSERLEFDRWGSAIGNTFDNIVHDVDYGAIYKIKDGAFHLFCIFNEQTGLNPSLYVYQNRAHNITIDWGDGQMSSKTNTGSTTINHTYSQAGEYEIIISRDAPEDYPTDYFYLEYNILSNSSSSSLNYSIKKAYMPLLYRTNLQNTYNAETVIYEKYVNTTSSSYIHYCSSLFVLHDTMNNGTISINAPCILIIDINNDSEELNMQGSKILYDKIIIPDTFEDIALNSNLLVNKVINRSSAISNLSFSHIRSFININPNLKSIPSFLAYGLEEFIYPDSVESFIGAYAQNSNIKNITLPLNCSITSSFFVNLYFLQYIQLYPDFDYSLNMDRCYNITTECLINILNNVKDNSNSTAKTITLADNVLANANTKYVVLDNSMWVESTMNTPNSITIIEAFTEKNWTVS